MLRAFLEARDADDSARELEGLLEAHALPLARAIVARKLRTYRTNASARSDAADREDVVADAMVTLIERLNASREDPGAAPIERLSSYTAAIVHSACAHYIRRRYPARARLKNRLRYVFSTDQRLTLWTDAAGELVAGLVQCSGQPASPEAERRLTALLDGPEGPVAGMSQRELTATLVGAMQAAGGPATFEAVVAAAAAASRLVEPAEVGDASRLPSTTVPHDVVLDQRRFLARVWEEVVELPVRQRLALLLNLRDATGAALLWLLPIAGVASIREIARLLEIGDTEFAALWRNMPLDDHAIGLRLGCTRQQVINLRMAARKRLSNRVRRAPGPVAGSRRGEGNLAPVSASVKGSV